MIGKTVATHICRGGGGADTRGYFVPIMNHEYEHLS